jgi:hypothetical protein
MAVKHGQQAARGTTVNNRQNRRMRPAQPSGRPGTSRTATAPHHAYEYFGLFGPVAQVGYTLLIYQITPEEAAAARRRMGLAPLSDEGAAAVVRCDPR